MLQNYPVRAIRRPRDSGVMVPSIAAGRGCRRRNGGSLLLLPTEEHRGRGGGASAGGRKSSYRRHHGSASLRMPPARMLIPPPVESGGRTCPDYVRVQHRAACRPRTGARSRVPAERAHHPRVHRPKVVWRRLRAFLDEVVSTHPRQRDTIRDPEQCPMHRDRTLLQPSGPGRRYRSMG